MNKDYDIELGIEGYKCRVVFDIMSDQRNLCRIYAISENYTCYAEVSKMVLTNDEFMKNALPALLKREIEKNT